MAFIDECFEFVRCPITTKNEREFAPVKTTLEIFTIPDALVLKLRSKKVAFVMIIFNPPGKEVT